MVRSHHAEQKRIEQYQVGALLDNLKDGIKDASFDCECPDLKLSLKDGRTIGVEIMAYTHADNHKTNNAITTLCEAYCEHLAEITENHYSVFIIFSRLNYPTQIRLKQHSKEIFQEIDSFMPGHTPYACRKYIEYAYFQFANDLPNFAGSAIAIEYKDIDEQKLSNQLQKKEKKLELYKSLPQNESLDEYWLTLYCDIKEHVIAESLGKHKRLMSQYDRIYATDLTNCVRIK